MAQLSVQQVLALAQRGDEATRMNAVRALYSLATAEAGQALRLLARDPSEGVRRLAVQAYQQLEARLGGPGSIPAGAPAGAATQAPSGARPAVAPPTPSGAHAAVAPPTPSGAHAAVAPTPSGAHAAVTPSPQPQSPPASGGDAGLAGLLGGGATSAAARAVQAPAPPQPPPAPAPAPAGGGDSGLAGLLGGGGATSAAARGVEAPAPAPAPQPAPAAGGGLAGLVGGGGSSAAAQAAAMPQAAPAPPAAPMPQAASAPAPAPGGGHPAQENFQAAVERYQDMIGRAVQAYESLGRLRDSALAQGVPEGQLVMPGAPGEGGEVEDPVAPAKLSDSHRQLLMGARQLAARGQDATPPLQLPHVDAMRAAACRLLEPCIQSCIEGLRDERGELAMTNAKVLGLLGPADAFGALSECIQEQFLNESVFEALGLLGDTRAVQLFENIYGQDRFANWRQFIVHAVARIPGQESGMFLARLLDDPDPSIRTATVNHIGACGRTALATQVLQRLGSGGDNADVAIAKALVTLMPDDPKVAEKLQERLMSSDAESRLGKALVAALGRTGSADALQALQPFTKSRDARLKRIAIDAVCDLNIDVDQKMKYITPSLREVGARGETPPKVRAQSAVKAAELGSDAGAAALLEMVQSDNGENRTWGCWGMGEIHHPQALGFLGKGVQDQDIAVKLAAIKALGTLADPKGVNHLARALKDPGDELRAAASEAIAELGPQGHAHLAELLDTEFRPSVLAPAVRAFGATDPQPPASYRVLEGFLTNDEAQVRLAATEAACRMVHEEATDALLDRLADPEHKVRRAAARGLWCYGEFRLIPRVLDLQVDEDDEVRLGGALILQELANIQRDLAETPKAGRLVAALHGLAGGGGAA